MHWFWLLLALADGPQRVRGEIVVVADRAPTPAEELTSAATVIGEKRIAATPGRSAADVLTLTPGIAVFGSASTAPATIATRGFYGGGEVEYVQMRIDGVPAGDVESGLAAWQEIGAGELGRMEVARGVVSPLYGDTAVGGVVELFTRERDGDYSINATAGTLGTASVSGTAWRDVAAGALSLTLSAGTENGGRPHDGVHRNTARLRWSGAAGDHTLLTFAAERRATDRDDAGPLPLASLDEDASDPLYRFDGERVVRSNASASVERLTWSGSLHAQSKSGDGVRTILIFPPSIADRTRRDLDSREIGGSLQLRREVDALSLRGGVDAASQSFAASYFDVATTHRLASTSAHRDVAAAWSSARMRLGDRVMFSAGLRGDDIRTRGNDERAWSPRVAVHVGDFYVSAGRGFKAPTIEQLYDVRPLRAFGQSFTLANPELVPQRVRSIEAGWSRASRFGALQIDAYRMHVDDEIDFDARTFCYGNISRSEHRGVELLAEGSSIGAVVPRVTYHWMRVFSLDDPSRAQLKNVPEHGGTAMLTARLPLAVSATALYSWNGGRWLDDAESIAAPDTRALSLRIARAFGPALVRFDVVNATNSANAALGFALADLRGRPLAYAYPDARRSVRLSVELRPHRKEVP